LFIALYLIHPISIAVAKPDLRFQRSLPVAAQASLGFHLGSTCFVADWVMNIPVFQ
jgi:hypothetical protein